MTPSFHFLLQFQIENLKNVLQPFLSLSKNIDHCGATWDGVYCWPQVPAGHLQTISCPDYIEGFDPQVRKCKMPTKCLQLTKYSKQFTI